MDLIAIARHPLYAPVLALISGVLGAALLIRGQIIAGGFAMWVCGINVGILLAQTNQVRGVSPVED